MCKRQRQGEYQRCCGKPQPRRATWGVCLACQVIADAMAGADREAENSESPTRSKDARSFNVCGHRMSLCALGSVGSPCDLSGCRRQRDGFGGHHAPDYVQDSILARLPVQVYAAGVLPALASVPRRGPVNRAEGWEGGQRWPPNFSYSLMFYSLPRNPRLARARQRAAPPRPALREGGPPLFVYPVTTRV